MDEQDLNNAFSKQYTIANEVAEPFSQLLWENPQEALDNIFDCYNNALDKAYTDKDGQNVRGFVEAVAGGPCETIPSALYTAVGAIYPVLDRETKDLALRRILHILDGINYSYVQLSHTSYIKEPLLLADIATVRPLYWPGLDEGKHVLKKNVLFSDFYYEAMQDGFFKKDAVASDFIVAYACLRNDMSRWGEEFVQATNPSFLDRVLKGILTMRVSLDYNVLGLDEDSLGTVDQEVLAKKVKHRIAVGTNRLRTLLPKSTHAKLDAFIEESEWLVIFDFIEHRNYQIQRVLEQILEE